MKKTTGRSTSSLDPEFGPNEFEDPNLDNEESISKDLSKEKDEVKDIKKRYENMLLAIDGVEGVGIGEESGSPVISIYVAEKTKSLIEKLPSELDGIRVRINESGKFKAL